MKQYFERLLLNSLYFITYLLLHHGGFINLNHWANWPYVPDHPFRILIIGGPGWGKNNALLDLIKHQRQDVDKIYLYVKDPFATKYQLFEKVGIKQTNQVIFIYYSQTIDHFYENLEDYNATKKRWYDSRYGS